MKKITVSVKDGTNAHLVKEVSINHLSDLGEGIRQAVDNFAETNEGVVMPPLSIKAVEKNAATGPA